MIRRDLSDVNEGLIIQSLLNLFQEPVLCKTLQYINTCIDVGLESPLSDANVIPIFRSSDYLQSPKVLLDRIRPGGICRCHKQPHISLLTSVF